MSEQQAEQSSGETGSLDAEPAVSHSSDTQNSPVMASGQESVPGSAQDISAIGSPDLVPAPDAALEADAKADAAKSEASEADALRVPGKVMIMSSGEHAWNDDGAGREAASEPDSSMFGKRRLSALAAVVTLAMLAGALGGALATTGLSHFLAGSDAAGAGNAALEASVARIEADVLALKAGVEHTSRMSLAQFNKTSDRLDKVEKAQAEPAAKLAKLSEAVDKLRAAPQPAPVPVATAPVVAPKEVTGSITPPAAAPAAPPKVEVGRLPTVEGWLLRDVANGGALIEGRQGIFEVYAGDPVPGLGRVEAIRRQDGRWVVVTSKGLIVAR